MNLSNVLVDNLSSASTYSYNAMKRQLSNEQMAMLKALADKPDADIDLSDIPEARDNAWDYAVRGEFYRPIKKQITVRIDADVLA